MAGATYLDKKLRIVHFPSANDPWFAEVVVSDGDALTPDPHTHYTRFENERPHPPYKSLVAVPIITDTACLGVLCFDCMNLGIFDDLKVQTLLAALGKRMATILLTYQQLERIKEAGQATNDHESS